MHASVSTPALFSRPAWIAIGLFTVACASLPLLNLAFPDGHALHVPAYFMGLVGKYMCYALAALALDLVWGYTGILSLGHGVFFALGGYAHGMYLMRAIGRDGVYQSTLPDFMVFLDWKTYPWYWSMTDNFWYCMALVVLVPGTLAFVFGFFAFRSRIKGVYFSITTQAMTYAFMLLFFRNDTGFGGNNGFTDFKRILGFSITAPATKATLYLVTLGFLLGALVACRWIVTSKLGRVLQAVRDAESRLMFIGYNPLWFKLFVWTLSPANSIEMVIWAAVGGRGTLAGPILGAFAVNGLKSWFTAAFPELWLFALGLLFILVTLFLQKGILGVAQGSKRRAPAPLRQDSAEPVEEAA
jgi:urea transport system permease protein